MARITSFREPGRRYAVLRVIAFLYTLIGVIFIAVGGCIPAIGLWTVTARDAMDAPPFMIAGTSLWWSLLLLLGGLQSTATGAVFRLMIHLEENTRVSAQMLEKLHSRLEPGPAGVEPFLQS